MRILAAIWLASVAAFAGLGAPPCTAADPIAIHTENPKYFIFRGKPLMLITATEHYGSVVNSRFDFERYLADAADKKQTLTRTFLLFREQQSSRNPYSPLKPESPDFIAPYPRTGPGQAMDGEPKYDLDRWNAEFFARLHRFLTRASELGIVVELTLFSNTYADNVWALNPLRAANNLQQVGAVAWQDYTSLKDAELNKRQFAYLAKIVEETSKYDNVYYEICNEPGGGIEGHATPADVDAWQAEVGRLVRESLTRLGRKHLVFGAQAFDYPRKVRQPLDNTFAGSMVDVVNVHPLPNIVLGKRTYNLGRFMSKDLALQEFADFCRAAQPFKKPCVLDEDNAATLYRDTTGWTIHRKRAWIAALSQAHYDVIDFSINVGSEAGTPASSAELRTWMKHLSEFVHHFDFIHAQPALDFIQQKPAHLVSAAMALPDKRYVAYLADAREVTDPAAGEPISGPVELRLPEGEYRASLFSPTSGLVSPAVTIRVGSEPVSLDLGEFRHDVVIDVRRR
jgi:hypothetical protein